MPAKGTRDCFLDLGSWAAPPAFSDAWGCFLPDDVEFSVCVGYLIQLSAVQTGVGLIFSSEENRLFLHNLLFGFLSNKTLCGSYDFYSRKYGNNALSCTRSVVKLWNLLPHGLSKAFWTSVNTCLSTQSCESCLCVKVQVPTAT